MKLHLYDIESNGLLEAKTEKGGKVTPPMDRVHCIADIITDPAGELPPRYISAADQPGYEKGWYHYRVPKEGSTEGETVCIVSVGAPPDHVPPGAIVWERMPIVDALRELEKADARAGHNIQDFDERALRRTYPWWDPGAEAKILDTLLLSRLIYPDIHRTGPNRHKLFGFELRLHSLGTWGKRLGEHKGEYTDWCKKRGIDPWAEWREEMQAYMEQDCVVGLKLFRWLWSQKPATTAVTLEHEFAAIIRRLESRGWAFDQEKAEALLAELQIKEADLETKLIAAFGEWWAPVRRGKSGSSDDMKARWKDAEEDELAEDEEEQAKRKAEFLRDQAQAYMVIPTKSYTRKVIGQPDIRLPRFGKKGNRLSDYVGPPKCEITQGCPYTPVKLVQFNPGSRTHIWQRLMVKYGWEPVKYTPGGKNAKPQPVVDEDILKGLPYPEAQLLAEYFLVLKRIGQLATGAKGWMKMARETEHPNGSKTYRIHGRINTNGAATGRCTHSNPNLAQVPKNTAGTKEYPDSPELHGTRCRELFIAGPGYILAGFDGAALELRMLAHYIRPWDKGEYSAIVVEGKKEEGTDPHSWLRDLIGTNLIGPGEKGRDNAKTTMYAELYGAGALKVGSIVMPTGLEKERMEIGREIKAKMADRFIAKTRLQQAIEEAVRAKGFLTGLDGRTLKVRKAHAALNTLLQSAGAVVMKQALVVLDRDLQRDGMKPGQHYEFVGNIHDEAQAEILPDIRDIYERHALTSLPKAGRMLKLGCPLAAEVSFGDSWRETH